MRIPASVAAAMARAEALGFELSCEPGVGRLLAVLVAAVPAGGRVLELGTGIGVGLAWMVHGLDGREDVELLTVDSDERNLRAAESAGWPPAARFVLGDGAVEAERLGQFDLIFADAPGGKLRNLEATLDALKPGGVLVVEDMRPDLHKDDPALRMAIERVSRLLLEDDRLITVELEVASGVVLATRRPTRT